MKRKANATKQTQGGSVLLHTYITSLLSLLLCVSMFMSTSFAWFTSEVNNMGNEIYVGILNVGLFKEVPGTQTVTVKAEDGTETNEVQNVTNLQDLSAADVKLFDSDIRWEPGYTAMETIQIVNKGDLAFKYDLSFVQGSIEDKYPEDGQTITLAEAAKYFEVAVYNHHKNEKDGNQYVAPTSYDQIAADPKWEKHSLADVLDQQPILKYSMTTVREANQNAAVINVGTTDGKATADRFTIALHLKDKAASELMGHKLGLNVKLVACQMPSEAERDAFGNKAYDDVAFEAASTVKELKELLAAPAGREIILSSNMTFSAADQCVVLNNGVLNGNGMAINYSGQMVDDASVGVLTANGGRINDLTVNGTANGRALYVTDLISNLNVSDCVLDGAYSFNLNTANKYNGIYINFANTHFKSWVSHANAVDSVNYTKCTFNNVLRPYGAAELSGCVFADGGVLDVTKLEPNMTVKLTNCTYNGVELAEVTVTNDGTQVVISGSDAIELSTAANGAVTIVVKQAN